MVGGHAAWGRRGLGGVTVALMVAGMLFTFLAAVSLWSWRTFATSDGFADVTSDMLHKPAVAEVVADQIVSALEDNRALAQAAQPRAALREIVKNIVTTDTSAGCSVLARELHAAVVGGHRTRMQVEVSDTPQLVKETLQIVNPALAAQIPDEALTVVVGLSHNRRADLAMRGADLAGWLIIPLTALAASCFVVAVRASRDRRRALQLMGLSILAVGVIIFTLLATLIVVVADVGQDPRERTALRAVFWSLMHVLNVTGKLLMVVGASLALAASIAGAESLESRLRSVAEAGRILLARPVTKALTAAAAIGIISARRFSRNTRDRTKSEYALISPRNA